MARSKRRFTYSRLRANHSYTLAELGQVCGVHHRTAQHWRSEGLAVLDENSKPLLVMGYDAIAFLKSRIEARRRPLKPTEFFCPRCRCPRASDAARLELLHTGKRLGKDDEQVIVHRLCPFCGCQLRRMASSRRLGMWSNEHLLDYFLQWHRHLESKGFGSGDPLFPRSKTEQEAGGLAFQAPTWVEARFWQGTGAMREIFTVRSANAELPYFAPHSYRHLAADLAIKTCRTGDQIKAVSQNLGHEHVATTLSAYGMLDPGRLSTIVSGLKPGAAEDPMDAKLKKIQEILST
jgi:hypothetical protein